MTTESRDARRLIESIFANRGWTNDELTAAVDKFATNAATRMRDACVRKVKSMRDGWLERERAHLDGHGNCPAAVQLNHHVQAAKHVIEALESLTPDQVEKKQ